MSETKLYRLVSTAGGIPQSMKTYRTINVTAGATNGKVIRVAMPQLQQKIVLAKSPINNITPDSNDEDRDTDGAPLSKNAILARENRLKKKRYINGLEQSLATTKKENEVLIGKVKERDETIEQLNKEINYFKSVLANVREISSLINTIKGEPSFSCGMPISTSLDAPLAKKMKLERVSESSSELSSIHEEDDNNWMPLSPLPATPLDADSLDFLSNFSEEDMNLFGDSSPTTLGSFQPPAGVCLHVYNKKLSLEFCPSCATRAQEKWGTV